MIVSKAFALGPHEIALVVNEDSIESILLADVYKRLRSIPDRNIIRVSLPKAVYDGTGTDISPENFTEYIWKPVMRRIDDTGMRAQILACVYSCGFPTRVTTTPAMSLTGLTFLRNKIPDHGLIEQGRYVSDLFAGPTTADAVARPSAAFDVLRNKLLDLMPFPAMMLAFIGDRGMTVGEAIASLEKTAAMDSTQPTGTFFFAVNNDVRSTCRHWEYAGAARVINSYEGQVAVVSTNMPSKENFPLAGFMTGAQHVPVRSLEMLPGAYGDNLTSWGADFERAAHTKVTDWFKTGVISSGTVVEPYAIWTKFANAFIFVHYLNGCTAYESIFKSVSCPLQILPLGDPLCNPWAPKITPVIESSSGALSGLADLSASVENENPKVFLRFNWLVDGVNVASGRNFVWDTKGVDDGRHRVRVVVKHQLESVRHQAFAEIEVEVNNGGDN
ncbi:MAG: TIGR03790 family protein [Lentisphaerae bacterium]|nr:TIGR03790 family protein [Lentisphaerota bacterium]